MRRDDLCHRGGMRDGQHMPSSLHNNFSGLRYPRHQLLMGDLNNLLRVTAAQKSHRHGEFLKLPLAQ